MAKLPPAFGGAPRVDRYEGEFCAIDGCLRRCRALSRYCLRHAQQYYRTRSPTGRIPRRGELRPYRELAEYALDRWGLGAHPAIVAAEETLAKMIRSFDTFGDPWRDHFRRLFHEGASGRELLLAILSVYGLREVGYVRAFGGGGLDDCVFFTTLGSRFLRVRPLGWRFTRKGTKEQLRLPGATAERLGRVLAEKVGALALQLWRRIETERLSRESDASAIREALERNPL